MKNKIFNTLSICELTIKKSIKLFNTRKRDLVNINSKELDQAHLNCLSIINTYDSIFYIVKA